MNKKTGLGILFFFLLSIFSTGCDTIQKKDTSPAGDFKRGPSGLIMEFVRNYPGDSYIVNEGTNENILIMIDLKNKGTYPGGDYFEKGNVYISGFDDEIIDMTGLTAAQMGSDLLPKIKALITDQSLANTKAMLAVLKLEDKMDTDEIPEVYLKISNLVTSMNGLGLSQTEKEDKLMGVAKGIKYAWEKSKKLKDPDMFLPAASPINPLGGFATVEFEGKIIADKITVDEYNPTIMATACYPYGTKASPTVCVDPQPFDDRQEKVCHIGSQTLGTQGAPVAVTEITQEAATDKIQFKITIKNVGDGDVINSSLGSLSKCSPLGGGKLDRKEFDRVQVTNIKIGSVDLWSDDKDLNKCSPFADGTQNIIRLFNGEGFVICTLTVSELGDVQSAYTTPLNIELEYNYRSTISKPIKISKLTTVG